MNNTQKRASLVTTAALLALALAGCASTSTEPTSTSGTMADQVSVTDAWVKEPTMPGMTGMFGVIENTGDSEVVIEGGSSDVAELVEIHEISAEGQMQKIAGGLPIDPFSTVLLEVGGNHVMLMNLTKTLAVGDEITVTLQFTDGSHLAVTAPVKSAAGGDESYDPSAESSSEHSEMSN